VEIQRAAWLVEEGSKEVTKQGLKWFGGWYVDAEHCVRKGKVRNRERFETDADHRGGVGAFGRSSADGAWRYE